jgi:hypothetical protein
MFLMFILKQKNISKSINVENFNLKMHLFYIIIFLRPRFYLNLFFQTINGGKVEIFKDDYAISLQDFARYLV